MVCTKTLATPLLPCFHVENAQNSSVTVQYFSLPSKSMCHIIWKPTAHDHPKLVLPHPTAHSFGPCIHHVKFVVARQPQFHFFYVSLLALLWIPDQHVSLLCHSSFPFWFIVVSSVFQLFSSLDRVSLILTIPTKFHQQLQPWIQSSPVTRGSRPIPPRFGGSTHCGFH